MISNMAAPVLEAVGEGKIALKSVNVEARIENLLCEVCSRQVYANPEEVTIEAVYTFPLPVRAVLLGLGVKTGDRELKGTVIAKGEAETSYEDAITDGDTAFMLEEVEPGLYTMNVGNLQPGETVEISITWAELMHWQGDHLRFFLPTTVAPRYGDPFGGGMQLHQAPDFDTACNLNSRKHITMKLR